MKQGSSTPHLGKAIPRQERRLHRADRLAWCCSCSTRNKPEGTNEGTGRSRTESGIRIPGADSSHPHHGIPTCSRRRVTTADAGSIGSRAVALRNKPTRRGRRQSKNCRNFKEPASRVTSRRERHNCPRRRIGQPARREQKLASRSRISASFDNDRHSKCINSALRNTISEAKMALFATFFEIRLFVREH